MNNHQELLKELQDLEKQLLYTPHVTLREIKTSRPVYDAHDFSGVYIIYKGDVMLKVGKTSGKPSDKRKENNLAGRLWGLTLADSKLREVMRYSLEQAEACSARCLRVPDELMRGHLEYYLMAKYQPRVNQDELAR